MDQLEQFLTAAEGFSPRMYPDCGHFSIGYGCQLTPDQVNAYRNTSISKELALSMLQQRVAGIREALAKRIAPNILLPHQFDMIVSLAYNCGVPAICNSTLLREVNKGDIAGAAQEFIRWDHVHDEHGELVEDEGLKARRKKEAAIFLSGY